MMCSLSVENTGEPPCSRGVLKTKTPKTPYQMTLNFIDLGLGN